MSDNSPLLRVENLRKQYGAVMAVRDVSFSVRRGEVVGLVGESGSGKTTVGRLVLRLLDATDGKINFDGIDLAAARSSQIRSLRRRMQIIFQDPFSSLNPHMRIGDALAEALIIHKLHGDRTIRRRRVDDLLTLVGLGPAYASRFPHELSGGQRQRVGIARALAVEPEFIVADEAVSALDISVQAQILNLLRALQRKLSLSLLFISHDLGVVRYLSDKVIVMYLGRVVEAAPTDVLFTSPKHPYTEALLASLPEIGTSRDPVVWKGDQPSALGTDSGCAFRTRCRYAIAQCAEIVPELKMIASEHGKACIRDDIL